MRWWSKGLPITSRSVDLSTLQTGAFISPCIGGRPPSDFGGIAPERLAAVGYGEFQPLARNDTPEGRQPAQSACCPADLEKDSVRKLVRPQSLIGLIFALYLK